MQLKKYLLSFLSIWIINSSSAQEKSNFPFLDFHAPTCENNCINKFDEQAEGLNNVNVFLLAKMTELMYLERLDYHLNYLHSDCHPIDTIPSSDWLSKNALVNDINFESAFRQRFQHFFEGGLESAADHEEHQGELGAEEHIQFNYIQKTHTEKAEFLGYDFNNSLDPELMIISTPKMILILYRGTDNVGKDQWGEWTGTNLRLNQMKGGGALSGTKLHTGFWLSFDLIRDELIATLAKFDAKNKKIWVAGHSLGAAVAVLTGVYLKSSGLDVQNVYAYACPRTIGNKAFIKKANQLLPNKIHRFEYYQDPVAMLWAPGYKYHHVGKRNWYDSEKKGKYKLYRATHERVYLMGNLKKYPNIDTQNKKDAHRIKRNQMSGLTFLTINMLHYHNPQWYVKAAYAQLTEEEKKGLPEVDETYPYLYFNRKGAK